MSVTIKRDLRTGRPLWLDRRLPSSNRKLGARTAGGEAHKSIPRERGLPLAGLAMGLARGTENRRTGICRKAQI